MNNDPELLKIKAKDDEIKDIKYTNEKPDHENILKSLKIDNEYYKKTYKNLKKKKILLIIIESLVGGGSTTRSSKLAILNPSAGIVISSSTALLTIIVILKTNEYISKLKTRYTKLRDCINVTTLFNEKTLKQSIITKQNDDKEAQ